MDENCISVMCSVNGCDWRVVSDTRCVSHGGHPSYAWVPSIWGGDDAEYNAATDNESPNHPGHPLAVEGHPS